MATLTDDVKTALVRALACFDTPSQAADAVNQEFGVKITRQQAAKYDPTKTGGGNLSQKLRALFYATREAFLKEAAGIPIAQASYRLRVLQRTLERAEGRGNAVLVLQVLEQAAKETGGAYVARRAPDDDGDKKPATTSVTVSMVDASVPEPADADA